MGVQNPHHFQCYTSNNFANVYDLADGSISHLETINLSGFYKLYIDRHLPQNHCFLLQLGLFYLLNNLLSFSSPSIILQLFHPFYNVLFYLWDQKVQCYDIDVPGSLQSQVPAMLIGSLKYFYPSNTP